MAKIKYSALVSDMRNKLNGSVLSKNRYGSYVRNKTTPVNPQTSAQQEQRQLLGSLSSQWRDLSQAQRDGWIEAAPGFQRTDQFGDQIKLAGNVLFIALNKNLSNASQSTIQDAPTPVEIPTIAISNLTVEIGVSSATFTIDPAAIPAGFSLFVKACAPVSPGRKYVKNLLRFIGVQTAAAGSVDFETDYVARFGTPVEGMRVTVQAYLVSNTTGQAGVPVSATTLVAVGS